MTAIFYRDQSVLSPDGRRRFEARSPHNGAIPHRNGRLATDDEFPFKYRQHQSHFRYRMLDHPTGQVLWERWQPDDHTEDSPGELLVGNGGCAVVCTHGFRPELIAFTPVGTETVRVELVPEGRSNPNRPPADGPRVVLERMHTTTAGYYWSAHSWPQFVTTRNWPLFSWRTWWGQRIVLDLQAGTRLDPSRKLAAGLDAAEARGVSRLFDRLLPHMGRAQAWLGAKPRDDEEVRPDPFGVAVAHVTAAAVLAAVHRVRACLPGLQTWEAVDVPGGWSSVCVLGSGWWQGRDWQRPVVRHALRCLGEQPAGPPPYSFSEEFTGKRRLAVPAAPPDRASRLAALAVGTPPELVLAAVGTPDHIGLLPSPSTGKPHVWAAAWEYDHLTPAGWSTWRLTWHDSDLVATSLAPPGTATSAERLAAILDR